MPLQQFTRASSIVPVIVLLAAVLSPPVRAADCSETCLAQPRQQQQKTKKEERAEGLAAKKQCRGLDVFGSSRQPPG